MIVAFQRELERLLLENNHLREENRALRQRADELWECVEDLAIGTKLECPKCGKPRPCLCQDT